MMGRQTGDQASLFYEFRLADRIPKDHLLRRINVVVGPVLDGVRGQLKPYYSQIANLICWRGVSHSPQLLMRSAANFRQQTVPREYWPGAGGTGATEFYLGPSSFRLLTGHGEL